MSTGRLSQSAVDAAGAARRTLPLRLRLLFIGPVEPPWPLVALRLETAGCEHAEFEWRSNAAEALATLRTHSFDAIVVQDAGGSAQSGSATHHLIEAMRGGGTTSPVTVLLAEQDDEHLVLLEDFDCEVLISRHGFQSRALVATIRRSVMRGSICEEVSVLESAARRGRLRERDDARLQLRQLQDLAAARRHAQQHDTKESPSAPVSLPAQIGEYYRELLRTFVMMGSGSMEVELQKLAEILSLSGTSLRESLTLHLEQLELLMAGLGNRSSRHIMTRANLLALELTIRLGECYRTKPRLRGLGDDGVDLLHAQTLMSSD